MSVFIISQDLAIQNVVEQVSMTCGYPSIVAGSVQEAEAKLTQLGSAALALIVVDTNVLDDRGVDIQPEACHLLQTWASQYPDLPVVFLGTALQKYAILAAQPALVPFVTMPFSPHDLMQTVRPLLPESNHPPPISQTQPRTTNRELGSDLMHEPPETPPSGSDEPYGMAPNDHEDILPQ